MIITDLFESRRLHVGDPIIVTAPNAYEGKTGEIVDFSPRGSFVIVKLYNGDEASMHMSDIEYNEYADEEEADEFWDSEEDGFEQTLEENKIDWDEYERRVQELEDQGVSRSDAQGIVDAEMMQKKSQALDEKQDACYRKVKSRYKVWPSAYASGALVQCRKKGAANWGNKNEAVAEGWSDAMVARRTGTPRTPYSVYIKGKKWKDFENDDHAEAVANKLRAKFKAEGRDASVITVAPTDYDKDMKEAISKKDLLKQIGDKLNDPEFRKKPADPKHKGWTGAGKDDYGYTGYQGHGMPTDKQERELARKKKGVAEDNWDTGDDVRYEEDDITGTYYYKGWKFIETANDAYSGEAWLVEPDGDETWYGYEVDENHGIRKYYDKQGRHAFNLSAHDEGQSTEKWLKAHASDWGTTSLSQPKPYTMNEQGVAEGSRGSAIQQGQQDYAKGLSKQQNPYYKSNNGKTPPAAYDWEAGWEDARDSGKKQGVEEEWSKKYKDSINCSDPKGFSQKAHCDSKKKNEDTIEKMLDENLRDWFGKEKWVRMDTKGNIKGDCARGSKSEGKPKCLPQAKAHALGKKGRAAAAQKKRREDPNPERKGKAINVATKVKEEQLDEKCWDGYKKQGMKKKGDRMVPNCVKNESAEIHEISSIDQLEQRRIDDLNDRMDGVIARISKEKIRDPDVVAVLMKQYNHYKNERDSYYKIRESKKKEISFKSRDPNYLTLTAKRTSGASGSHVNKKRDQQQGKLKHKAQELDLAEATKAKTVAKLAPAIKLFQATIRVKMPDYTGLMDVNVTAQNINMARQMVKAMYNIQNSNVVNVKEVKALREGSSYTDKLKEWTNLGFAVSSEYLWPAELMEQTNSKTVQEFSNKLDQYRNSLDEPRKGAQCILAFVVQTPDLIYVIHGNATYQNQTDNAYVLTGATDQLNNYTKKDRLIFDNKNSFDKFITWLQLSNKSKDIDVKVEEKPVLENTKDKDELNPGEYYIWRVYFDDGSSKRIKVTSGDFDPYKYYAKKNQNVINVDFNWEKHK